MPNQNPEQIARDKIDNLLELAGWKIQSKSKIDFSAGIGVAVREYQTDAGPADYVLFVNRKPVGIIEAKREEEGANLTVAEVRPNDDNRKFTELYNVQRLSSNFIANDSQVCISTIQRLYSILKGEELDESAETDNPNESSWLQQKIREQQAIPVEYTPKVPIEQFDFVVIDECHRSIYNLWKQVL